MNDPKEILKTTAHRNEAIPTGKWKYYQEWNKVLFLHWQVAPDVLKTFVPKPLDLDLLDGQAWVSLVAFTMNKVHPAGLLPFSPLSDFHEVNIRTYVKCNDVPGVYFLSMEAGARAACLLAGSISGLPYRYSKINRTANKYFTQNSKFQDRLELEFESGAEIQNLTETETWLLERYALLNVSKSGVFKYDVHHIPWPLNELQIKNSIIRYQRFGPLLTTNPDLVHYSPGLSALAWPKTKLV